MVVRMVVRVFMDNMASKVLYPPEEQSAERIALLTGIVQLVQSALKRDESTVLTPGVPFYMKSDKGTVGYMQREEKLYICEAESESEAGNILTLIRENLNCNEEELIALVSKALRKRGKEISSLWG
ncbi:MAG: hypothetical protein RTU92_00340 [Candidatus Thorarchaeota archaeon]